MSDPIEDTPPKILCQQITEALQLFSIAEIRHLIAEMQIVMIDDEASLYIANSPTAIARSSAHRLYIVR